MKFTEISNTNLTESFKIKNSNTSVEERINENISALQSELEQKYNLKSLFLADMGKRNAIELHSIIVNKEEQGSGTGSKVMQEIIAYADANGKIVVLDPGLLDKQHGTTSQSRLRKFYKRFGFIDNKGRNKNYEFRNLMIRYPQSNESLNEGYKLQLERDTDMMVLNITDTKTGKRTEVRGKSGYETNNYDENDKLHQLLDKISKSANISDLMNGEVVGINPKHPDGPSAKTATTTAFNESLDNPYPFELIGPNDSQEFSALAQTPNGMLRMDFEATDYDNFGIDFSVGKSMGKTEAGDEFKVFATVVAMMKKWIKTVGIEHVESFDFGANKGEHASDGRAKLYTRFAKQLASKLGWKLDQSTTGNGDTAFFKLTNPNPTPREQEYWDALEETVNEATEMKISDLTISDAGMAIAQSVGGGSRTDAPLAVTKLPSGHVYLVNGYHRLVDAMNSGKDTVSVKYVPYEKVEILWKQEREQDIKYGKQFSESVAEAEDTLTLPKIKVGDEVMVGKFKNRKAEVKGFSKDEHNQPVLNTTKGDQKLFKLRLAKLMKDK